MITAIRIKNYKGIREMDRLALEPFHVLIGPNGSGKSTFLDAIEFVKACLQEGPLKAVEARVPEFRDLTFMRRGGNIEIDLWLDLSPSIPALALYYLLHYKMVIAEDDRLGVRVHGETLGWERVRLSMRPLLDSKKRRLVGKTRSGKDFYQRETGGYQDTFNFGPEKLALSLTPPDETRYSTANIVKSFLMQGIRYVQLNSVGMRQPCPATRPTELDLDGTNLARVVGRLFKGGRVILEGGDNETPLDRWTSHLRYALDDLDSISWAARKPDNAEYVVLKYAGGLECPSWLLSDGTLRMLALTLPAFLPAMPRIYMVEEPENGVHPKALEIILKALAAIPDAQVFIATHSPLVVQQEGVDSLLCFSRDEDGVHVMKGAKHPALKDWDGVPDLATIFSARVLG